MKLFQKYFEFVSGLGGAPSHLYPLVKKEEVGARETFVRNYILSDLSYSNLHYWNFYHSAVDHQEK